MRWLGGNKDDEKEQVARLTEEIAALQARYDKLEASTEDTLEIRTKLAASEAANGVLRDENKKIRSESPKAPNLYKYGLIRCGENYLQALIATLRAHDPGLEIHPDSEGWWVLTKNPIEEAKDNAITTKIAGHMQLDKT